MNNLLTAALAVLLLPNVVAAQPKRTDTAPKVTFIELGSVNCIPCRKMQPVMKAIEERYAGSVRVVFYDVWTDAQKHFARTYGVRLIPTQVFLDEHGKEFFRHEGFFAEADIRALLKRHGVMPTEGARAK